MTKIRLSKRLQTVANYVDACSITDVGCDHGKLTAYLFQNKLITYAFVSDISAGSLAKAVKLLTQIGANFSSAVCDGVYPAADVQMAVICGMGGQEIIKILQNDESKIDKFILGPQHNEIELKKYLESNNYHITKDVFVCDGGKFYNIIKCHKDCVKHVVPSEQLYFGMDVPEADYITHIEMLQTKFTRLKNSVPPTKAKQYNSMLCLIDRIIKRRKNNETNT